MLSPTAPAPTFFKNCRVPHPHPYLNPETYPCFIGPGPKIVGSWFFYEGQYSLISKSSKPRKFKRPCMQVWLHKKTSDIACSTRKIGSLEFSFFFFFFWNQYIYMDDWKIVHNFYGNLHNLKAGGMILLGSVITIIDERNRKKKKKDLLTCALGAYLNNLF